MGTLKKPKAAIVAASLPHLLAWAATFWLVLWPYFYQGVELTPAGQARTSASLIEVNGVWVVGLMLIPVTLSGVGMFAVLLRDAIGRWVRPVLWACAILLLAFCGVGIWSIGAFYLPAALAAAVMR